MKSQTIIQSIEDEIKAALTFQVGAQVRVRLREALQLLIELGKQLGPTDKRPEQKLRDALSGKEGGLQHTTNDLPYTRLTNALKKGEEKC